MEQPDLAHVLDPSDEAQLETVARQLVAQQNDYPTEREMREELNSRGVDLDAIDSLAFSLASDPAAIDSLALTVISLAWDDVETRSAVLAAMEDSKSKLPVIEVGLLTIALIYGIHMYYTKGRSREVTVVRRDAAGNLETITTTEWWDVSAPIRGVVDTVTGGALQQPPPQNTRGELGTPAD